MKGVENRYFKLSRVIDFLKRLYALQPLYYLILPFIKEAALLSLKLNLLLDFLHLHLKDSHQNS
jgi:hypothetical protein